MDFSKLTQDQLMKHVESEVVDLEDYDEFVSEEDKNGD